MASLNIQLDNLCQFLPQDRVQEFAKMDSVLLLQSTEQAIGSDTLARKHEFLISINKSIKQLEYALKNHVESLRVEEQKNQRVETEVEAFQERERIKNIISELVGKKAWFQFIKAKNIYTEVSDTII
jgi:chromosome segregation ATPase